MVYQQFRRPLPFLNIRRLWIASVISQSGDFFSYIAVLNWIRTHVGTAHSLSGWVIAQSLAIMFTGILTGVWVDRYDRKKILIITDLVRAALVLSIPFIPAVRGLYVIGFLLAALTSLYASAQNALLPSLVPSPAYLLRVNSWFAFGSNAVRILLPSIAGMVVETTPLQAPFVIDSFTFLLSALLLSRISPDSLGEQERPPGKERFPPLMVLAMLKEAFQFIYDNKGALSLLVSRIGAAFGAGILRVVLILHVSLIMQKASIGYGISLSAISAGSLLSVLILGVLKRRLIHEVLYGKGLLLVGIGYIGVSMARSPYFLFIFLFINGLGDGAVIASFRSLSQVIVPESLRGRFFGILATSFRLASTIGAGVAGVVGDLWGSDKAILLSGAIILSAAIFYMAIEVLPLLPCSRNRKSSS